MPRPIGRVPEKSKNFSVAIIRLFNSLNKFKYLSNVSENNLCLFNVSCLSS